MTVKDTQGVPIRTKLPLKIVKCPTFMLTLFSEPVPLKALFLKGEYQGDSPPSFLIATHGVDISWESWV